MILRLEKIRVIDICLMMDNKSLNLEPSFQRAGGLWNTSKQIDLIDTIIKSLDVPKFYFSKTKDNFEYEVVDGKQRLEAIYAFYKNKIKLEITKNEANDMDIFDKNNTSKDFVLLSFDDLKEYSWLYKRFINFELHVMIIDEAKIYEIENFFIRLNSGVPLIESEKRYALQTTNNKNLIRLTLEFKPDFNFTDIRKYHYDTILKMAYLSNILIINNYELKSVKSLNNDNLVDFINQDFDYFQDFSTLLRTFINEIKVRGLNYIFSNRNNLIVFFIFYFHKRNTINNIDFFTFLEIFLEVINQDDNYYVIKDFKIKSQQNTSSKNSILGRLLILDKLYSDSKKYIIYILENTKEDDL